MAHYLFQIQVLYGILVLYARLFELVFIEDKDGFQGIPFDHACSRM